MATIIARQQAPVHFEEPEPSAIDDADFMGMRLGAPVHIPIFAKLGMATQAGTIWLGTWGVLSVVTFIVGNFVLLWAGLTAVNGNVGMFLKYFANIQELPPDGLTLAPSLRLGGFWQINLFFWVLSVAFWAGRLWDRQRRYKMRPFILLAFAAAISLTTVIWVVRPILMGNWSEAPGLGLNVDLDWAQNFSVLWGNLYYNPWHMLAIFFLFGSVMLWGMHGATILATAAEGSHMEDAEIKDMHSGSHKSMLFWRWTMGFNANPKTIHDWLLWYSVGTVVASAIGLLVTGTMVKDWYVWGVDHGWVQQYGPITRSAINTASIPFNVSVPVGDEVTVDALQLGLDQRRHVPLTGVVFAPNSATLPANASRTLGRVAQILNTDPSMKLEIDANVDDTENAAAAMTLTKAQADAVRASLINDYHINGARLSTVGYGDTHPIAQNENSASRALNRRIEIVRVGE